MAAVWRLLPSSPRVHGAQALQRRGVLHGYLLSQPDAEPGAADSLAAAWQAAEPITLPGILAPALASFAPAIEESRALFDHLRRGGRFLDAMLLALEGNTDFRLEGSTFDRTDAREIEKVFVSPLIDGRRDRTIGETWAKLAWIAHDDTDLSLRIRFSCGTEQLHDWHENVAGQIWSDRLAQALFPECAAIVDNAELIAFVQEMIGDRPRFSERIIYSNSPGGGAVFHHDEEPTQRAVVYGQLWGATAWLALPARELAAQVAAHAIATGAADLPRSAGAALPRLYNDDDAALFRLLNQDPVFSARLAGAGWLCVLEAGDALLLPSHDRDRVAWHSVFALGDEPSLAHSFGVFAAAGGDRRAEPSTGSGSA